MGDIKDVFQEIYDRNVTLLGSRLESISGSGSSLDQTKVIRQELYKIFRDYKSHCEIISMLDIPCGDFHWMSQMNLKYVHYIGADIIPDLVARNRKLYGPRFFVKDITCDKLPRVDLIFCRDCLVHFSNADIYRALFNIRQSGSKYLLTTSFVQRENIDIETGQWRALNLLAEPFDMGTPLEVINEGCTEEGGQYKDKSLVLWKI